MKRGVSVGLAIGLLMAMASRAHAQVPAATAQFEEPPPTPPTAAPPAPASAQPPASAPAQPQAPAPAQPQAQAPVQPQAPAAKPSQNFFDDADQLSSDPEPSSGLGLVISGWALAAAGAGALVSVPVCYAEEVTPKDQQDLCVDVRLVLGGITLAVGVPLLIAGYNQRAHYKEWRARHPVLHQLEQTGLAVHNNSAFVMYAGTF